MTNSCFYHESPSFNAVVPRPQGQREPRGGAERPAAAVPAQGVLPEDWSAGNPPPLRAAMLKEALL